MLDSLFPRVSKKCLALPLFGPVIEDFSEWLSQQGYTRLHRRAVLNIVRKLDRYLWRKGIRRLEDITSLTLDRYWRILRRRAPWEAGAVRLVKRFLKMRGGLNHCPVITPTDLQVAEYAQYLREVRGLAPSTLGEQRRIAAGFLAYLDFDKAPERLAHIGPGEIEGFVRKLGKSLSRATLQGKVLSLRAFLRFLATTGKVAPGLADQVDSPRVYRREKLPRTLPWKTVQALLQSIPKTTVKGRRDYTMLFLLATYGLRSCELVALTLDDLDWRAGLIRIRQTKTRNEIKLPLTDEATSVLIEYLRHVPRPAGYRELFFQVRAPIRPLRREALREAFEIWAKRSGLDIPFCGPHCLRHAYAHHLLRQGTALKTIGDLLGHRSPESTVSYLRLATEELREVGLPVPQPISKKGGRHET
ncbi:MAG: tyrosine-type recombinase/integrase [Blastocatellia bacterium]